MTKVAAGITTSLDGYITGPNDGPGRGLGDGGERLHYWVFGGPWSYAEEPRGEPAGPDKQVLEEAFARVGAVIGGRNTYDAAEAWGGQNPFGVPFFILTHRPPPDVPADTVATLRQAFDATMKDPGFVEAARRCCVELTPGNHSVVEGAVSKAISAPKSLLDRFMRATGS